MLGIDRSAASYAWTAALVLLLICSVYLIRETLIVFVIALLLAYRRQPAMFFFGLFAFITFLPTSNFLFPTGIIMAERLLYLPALGLIACLVLAVYQLEDRFRLRALAPAVLLLATCGCALRTWARNPDWRNNLTLGESAVRAAPQSYKARELLANALYDADPQHSQLDRDL